MDACFWSMAGIPANKPEHRGKVVELDAAGKRVQKLIRAGKPSK